MLVVSGLFERCSMYLCIVSTLNLVAFSISFILIVFVFVAYGYCFHVNYIRPLRVSILVYGDRLTCKLLHLAYEHNFRTYTLKLFVVHYDHPVAADSNS